MTNTLGTEAVWAVPKIRHDENADVGPDIIGDWIYRAAGQSDVEHTRQYAAQLLAAADELERRHQADVVTRPNGSDDRVPSRVQARDEPCADPVNCDVHRATTAPQPTVVPDGVTFADGSTMPVIFEPDGGPKASTVEYRCPGSAPYGHGLTEATVHLAGCCDRFAALSAAEQAGCGLRYPATAPSLTCGAVNPATDAVCELGPHPGHAEHYGPTPEGRRRPWRPGTDSGSNPGGAS